MRRRATVGRAARLCAAAAAAAAASFAPPPSARGAAPRTEAMAALHERAGREGTVPVIVELRLPSGARAPRGASPAALAALRSEIAQARGRVLGRLAGRRAHVRREFRTVPFVALEADAETLQALLADDEVLQVTEDRLAAPQLAESGPLVQAPVAWAGGRDGAGHVVAVLDTGVDGGHSFLAGKVVDEACFARPGGCPNGLATQAGAGAAVPCAFTPSICRHGTHVAGIAVGAGSSFSGVARGAGLAAIQVFHPETECSPGEAVPCARAYSSDIGAALEHVYERRAEHAIAAVNLSLGSGLYASTCDADDPQLAAQVANLRAVGIATVVSAGNGGATGALSWPACLSAAVSVGSTTEADAVSPFSNAGPHLSLFAPGSSITSSVPGELFATFAGTSMAAPHVAGAFAVLRQAHPSGSVSALLGALQQTGLAIADLRPGGTAVKPRIRIADALTVPVAGPPALSVSAQAVATGTPVTVTLANGPGGTEDWLALAAVGSPATSVVQWTWVGAGQSSATWTVTPPGPGTYEFRLFVENGYTRVATSPAVSVGAAVGPTLAIAAGTLPSGAAATVTLGQGRGAAFDWLALARVGAPVTSVEQWTYVGAGVSSRTWTVTPAGAGTYEFRLFLDNGYTLAATSPSFSVLPPPSPPTLAVSAEAVVVGQAVTVTLADGAGGALDWLALAPEGSTSDQVTEWTYVGAGVASRTWTVTPPAAGRYEFRLFLANGYTLGARSAAVAVSAGTGAALSVSASAVNAGGTVTVTLSNGPGGAANWLALAPAGSPPASVVQWLPLGAGITQRTWAVTPPGPTRYEFRLFLDNAHTLGAASAPVAVLPLAEPALSVAPAAAAGSPVTATLTNGRGASGDWLALAPAGAPDGSLVQWTYVGAGTAARTWTVTPPGPGTYEFRLFYDHVLARAATSAPVTVSGVVPEGSLGPLANFDGPRPPP